MTTFPVLPALVDLVTDDPAWRCTTSTGLLCVTRLRLWSTDRGHLAVVSACGPRTASTHAAMHIWSLLVHRYGHTMTVLRHTVPGELHQVSWAGEESPWRQLWPLPPAHPLYPLVRPWIDAFGDRILTDPQPCTPTSSGRTRPPTGGQPAPHPPPARRRTQRRAPSPTRRPLMERRRGPRPTISREQLRDMADRGLTRTQAAGEAGVSYQTVRNACERYAIQLRPVRGAQAHPEPSQRRHRADVAGEEIAAAVPRRPAGGRYADIVAMATEHPDRTPAQLAAALGAVTTRGVVYHLQDARQRGDLPARASHPPLPLVGLIEIARRAGVRRMVVTDWRTRHNNFPQPVAELQIGPVFWWPDVQGWLRDTGRSFDQDRQDLYPADYV